MINRIKHYRRLRGFTQEQLAEALGVDPTTVGRWEKGSMAFTSTSLEAMARVLGVRVVQLVDDDPALTQAELEILELVRRGDPEIRALLRRMIAAAVDTPPRLGEERRISSLHEPAHDFRPEPLKG